MPSSESTASPGHAEEGSAPAESSVHQHTEGHTGDDRQVSPPVIIDRRGQPLRSAQSGGMPAAGRHGEGRDGAGARPGALHSLPPVRRADWRA